MSVQTAPATGRNVLQRRRAPWRPIPNSSQELALDTRAQITFYHGARGPGKTDCQLMRFYRRVGQGYGPFWRGVIFDREYKMLDDIISKARRHFAGWNDGAKFLSSTSDMKWVWPGGEELLFRQLKKPADYWNYHGQEFPFIGWNEICKYPTSELLDSMMSCNRSSFLPEKDGPINADGSSIDVPPIPLEVFITGNPYGPGHTWVKQRFIRPAPNGTIVHRVQKVFNPQTQAEEEVDITQVSIFGSYKENIYLDPKYVAQLESTKDPNKRKAWLKGDWDIVAGGALDDVWNKNVHVLPRFAVPSTWRLDRSFDWGSTHPSATVWWAEADGTAAILPNGRTFCPPRGSLIAFSELYTNDPEQSNTGLKLSATKVAQLIREREMTLMMTGPSLRDRLGHNGGPPLYNWIASQPWPGPADNQIRDVRDVELDTHEVLMGRVGVRWTSSDKSSGSRKVGLEMLRNRLENAMIFAEEGDAPGPGLYFMDNCRYCIDTIPVLPRDEDDMDDVDTEAEDHLYDAVRYRVLASSNRYATNVKFKFAH